MFLTTPLISLVKSRYIGSALRCAIFLSFFFFSFFPLTTQPPAPKKAEVGSWFVLVGLKSTTYLVPI